MATIHQFPSPPDQDLVRYAAGVAAEALPYDREACIAACLPVLRRHWAVIFEPQRLQVPAPQLTAEQFAAIDAWMRAWRTSLLAQIVIDELIHEFERRHGPDR